MDKVKKVVFVIRDIVEVYVPIIAFVLMFVVFVAEVLARYVFNHPLAWAYEVTVCCYLWMVVLSACFVQRNHSHVTFTLIYDKLNIKGKAVCAFLGNLLIAVAFAVSIVPSIKFVGFMKMQVTSVFKIGLNLVYLPYIPFLVLILIYILYDMFVEFMVFAGLGGQKYVDMMLESTKSETEEAIENAMEIGSAIEEEVLAEKEKEGEK